MRNDNPSQIRDYNPPKNHHGFVYVPVGKEDGIPLRELRKPTPDERVSIVSNYIRMHEGEGPIKVSFLSERLGVSDRTIQGIIRQLEKEGTITTTAVFSDTGRQQGNLYHWTGKVDPVIGSPTMELLYKRYDSYGFRSYTWDDFKMERNPSGKLTCHDYEQYIILMDEKKRLKRKNEKAYRKNLKRLESLKVHDKDNRPI